MRQAENFVKIFKNYRQKSKNKKFANIIDLETSISNKIGLNVFIENKKNIIESLDEYILNINNFKKLIESSDQENLNTEMKKINGIKEILKGIN